MWISWSDNTNYFSKSVICLKRIRLEGDIFLEILLVKFSQKLFGVVSSVIITQKRSPQEQNGEVHCCQANQCEIDSPLNVLMLSLSHSC